MNLKGIVQRIAWVDLNKREVTVSEIVIRVRRRHDEYRNFGAFQ